MDLHGKDLRRLIDEKYPKLFEKPGSKQFRALKKDIERLQGGEPLAYVIGWAPFLNCKIDLSEKPLIPRPETEFWTEEFIKHLSGLRKKLKRTITIADVFAGSGCIGIAVAKNDKNTFVTFADKEPSALAQIRKNLKLNKIKNRGAKIIRADILKGLGKFDFVVANPPYIPSGRKLPKSVTKFEKRSYLYGGKDGLFYIKKLLASAKEHLGPKGELWFEFDVAQARKLPALIKKSGFTNFELKKDQYDRYRYAILRVINLQS